MMKKITILLLALLLLTGCSKKPAATEAPDATETQTQRPGSFGNDNAIDFDDFFEEETQPQESGRPSVPQGSQPTTPGTPQPTVPETEAAPEQDPEPSTEAAPDTPVETPTEENTDSTENTNPTQETTATPPPPVIGSDGYYGSILRP